MATTKELEAKIAELEKANANLVAAQPNPRELTLKVSETTGVISLGGIGGRFPVSLYRSSWQRLFTPEVAKWILEWIKENDKLITDTMKANGKTDR